jgi:hypothetical protein
LTRLGCPGRIAVEMNSTMIKSVSELNGPWGLHASLVLSSHPRVISFERITAMKEIWKPVVGYEGRYDISSCGRLRSYWSIKYGIVKEPQRIIRSAINTSGYFNAVLSNSFKQGKTMYIHRLVLDAFVGLRPKGYECCHKNNNKLDNRIENLEWGTQSHNRKDFGTQSMGTRVRNSKLFPLDIIMIRERYKQGIFQRVIGRLYGVRQDDISRICSRKYWKHIP